MLARLTVAAVVVVFASGCRDSKPPAAGQGAAAAGADGGYVPAGKRPVNPKRASAPPTIGSAVAVGATAPDFDLPATTGQARLADVLARGERALLVFYRGDW